MTFVHFPFQRQCSDILLAKRNIHIYPTSSFFNVMCIAKLLKLFDFHEIINRGVLRHIHCLLYASVHDIVADCDKGKVKAKIEVFRDIFIGFHPGRWGGEVLLKKERGYTDIDVFRSSCLLYASVHDIVADCDKGKVKAKGPFKILTLLT